MFLKMCSCVLLWVFRDLGCVVFCFVMLLPLPLLIVTCSGSDSFCKSLSMSIEC